MIPETIENPSNFLVALISFEIQDDRRERGTSSLRKWMETISKRMPF